MRDRLFRELLECHDSILGVARDGSWIRDFAVGQVILSNELQSQAICELMLGRVDDPSLQTLAGLASD